MIIIDYVDADVVLGTPERTLISVNHDGIAGPPGPRGERGQDGAASIPEILDGGNF
ncbi:hypothetical protein [Brevundimonas sp. NPDC058933]|uniref:hypothetical protein n=1 Tax=Brevundimonas sp. NPDC058933 TaxID=3346673 RepID=UPI003BEF2ECA